MRQPPSPQEFLHCSVSHSPLPCAPPVPPLSPSPVRRPERPHSSDLPHLFPPTPTPTPTPFLRLRPGPSFKTNAAAPVVPFIPAFRRKHQALYCVPPSKRPSRFFSLRPVLTVTADDRRQSSSQRRALLSLTSTFLSGLSHPTRTTHDIVDRPRPSSSPSRPHPDGFTSSPTSSSDETLQELALLLEYCPGSSCLVSRA